MSESGPSFLERVKKVLKGDPYAFTKTSIEPTTQLDSTTPSSAVKPSTAAAASLDERNRTFGFRGDGSPKTTAPTAEGMAKAEVAVAPQAQTPSVAEQPAPGKSIAEMAAEAGQTGGN